MKKIGRNDPCPCGSGKKYKTCCLSLASSAAAELRDALEDNAFETLEEAEEFANSFFQQSNQLADEDFCGLSPEQVHQLLYLPFDCSDTVFFSESVLPTLAEQAPLQRLFNLMVEAIGEDGLKATAKGNLPQKFCKTAYEVWLTFNQKRFVRKVNKEDDFPELNTTRLIAELAGFITRRKGYFYLSGQYKILQKKDPYAIYPKLFRTYVTEFNWGYLDGYDEAPFIQQSFVFSLYLLHLFGGKSQLHTFYEDHFLRAFPVVLDEFSESNYRTVEDSFRHCYTLRVFIRFLQFLGLAHIEEIESDRPYFHDYKIKKQPLLDELMKVPLKNGGRGRR